MAKAETQYPLKDGTFITMSQYAAMDKAGRTAVHAKLQDPTHKRKLTGGLSAAVARLEKKKADQEAAEAAAKEVAAALGSPAPGAPSGESPTESAGAAAVRRRPIDNAVLMTHAYDDVAKAIKIIPSMHHPDDVLARAAANDGMVAHVWMPVSEGLGEIHRLSRLSTEATAHAPFTTSQKISGPVPVHHILHPLTSPARSYAAASRDRHSARIYDLEYQRAWDKFRAREVPEVIQSIITSSGTERSQETRGGQQVEDWSDVHKFLKAYHGAPPEDKEEVQKWADTHFEDAPAVAEELFGGKTEITQHPDVEIPDDLETTDPAKFKREWRKKGRAGTEKVTVSKGRYEQATRAGIEASPPVRQHNTDDPMWWFRKWAGPRFDRPDTVGDASRRADQAFGEASSIYSSLQGGGDQTSSSHPLQGALERFERHMSRAVPEAQLPDLSKGGIQGVPLAHLTDEEVEAHAQGSVHKIYQGLRDQLIRLSGQALDVGGGVTANSPEEASRMRSEDWRLSPQGRAGVVFSRERASRRVGQAWRNLGIPTDATKYGKDFLKKTPSEQAEIRAQLEPQDEADFQKEWGDWAPTLPDVGLTQKELDEAMSGEVAQDEVVSKMSQNARKKYFELQVTGRGSRAKNKARAEQRTRIEQGAVSADQKRKEDLYHRTVRETRAALFQDLMGNKVPGQLLAAPPLQPWKEGEPRVRRSTPPPVPLSQEEQDAAHVKAVHSKYEHLKNLLLLRVMPIESTAEQPPRYFGGGREALPNLGVPTVQPKGTLVTPWKGEDIDQIRSALHRHYEEHLEILDPEEHERRQNLPEEERHAETDDEFYSRVAHQWGASGTENHPLWYTPSDVRMARQFRAPEMDEVGNAALSAEGEKQYPPVLSHETPGNLDYKDEKSLKALHQHAFNTKLAQLQTNRDIINTNSPEVAHLAPTDDELTAQATAHAEGIVKEYKANQGGRPRPVAPNQTILGTANEATQRFNPSDPDLAAERAHTSARLEKTRIRDKIQKHHGAVYGYMVKASEAEDALTKARFHSHARTHLDLIDQLQLSHDAIDPDSEAESARAVAEHRLAHTLGKVRDVNGTPVPPPPHKIVNLTQPEEESLHVTDVIGRALAPGEKLTPNEEGKWNDAVDARVQANLGGSRLDRASRLLGGSGKAELTGGEESDAFRRVMEEAPAGEGAALKSVVGPPVNKLVFSSPAKPNTIGEAVGPEAEFEAYSTVAKASRGRKKKEPAVTAPAEPEAAPAPATETPAPVVFQAATGAGLTGETPEVATPLSITRKGRQRKPLVGE